jgi:hypothetical protein
VASGKPGSAVGEARVHVRAVLYILLFLSLTTVKIPHAQTDQSPFWEAHQNNSYNSLLSTYIYSYRKRTVPSRLIKLFGVPRDNKQLKKGSSEAKTTIEIIDSQKHKQLFLGPRESHTRPFKPQNNFSRPGSCLSLLFCLLPWPCFPLAPWPCFRRALRAFLLGGCQHRGGQHMCFIHVYIFFVLFPPTGEDHRNYIRWGRPVCVAAASLTMLPCP